MRDANVKDDHTHLIVLNDDEQALQDEILGF